MLHLCYGNQLEVLVAPLAAQVAAAQAVDPLAPITIVVPNQAVAQFVRFRLAEQLGVAANLTFGFLRRYLTDVVTRADNDLRILDVESLGLLIHGRLQDEALLEQPAMGPVRSYFEAAQGPLERARRGLQLSGQLARLFEEYGYSRDRTLIQPWADRATLQGTPYARAERWQRLLWRTVFDRQGVAQVQASDRHAPTAGQMSLFGGGPRWMLLPHALRTLDPRRLPLPKQLHVFGLSYVAPAFGEIFRRLAVATELNVYALNPCMEFWEDVDVTSLRVIRRDWARRDEAVELELDEDPFELVRPGDHPALRLWGRPGREYIRLLNQLTDCEFAPGFIDPTARGDTLLTQMQRDILVRHPERPPVPEGLGRPADESVRFLACPGVRREVEIVADEIWRLVAAADARGERLRFHQIAVMVADNRREAYLTHVEAVFRERHDLPFNVIDRRLSARSRVLEAVERLLDLPLGNFEVADLLPLLTHPSVGGAHPETDLDRWRRWITELNVKFGADFESLNDTYIDRDVYNWDQALRRLALGAFMLGERSGATHIFETADGGEWLPYETPAEARDDVGRLIALTRCLVADARAAIETRLAVAEWAGWLAELVNRYVVATEPADELAMTRCLRAFEALAEADLEGLVVPYAVVRDLARERLHALDAGRGQHQADGVVVSSLLPMRAIPFEVVFVLGLGEGEFPAPVRLDPLDLRQAQRRAGDVSTAERDRYLFLETLLAARQGLVLSWVARDDRTGEPLEPASVVRELQYVLRGYVDAPTLERLTVAHPVSAFDPAYFPEVYGSESPSEPIRSMSPEAERGARARALRDRLETHVSGAVPDAETLLIELADDAQAQLRPLLKLPPPPPEPEAGATAPITLPLAAIQRFLESPLQGAARYVLGLQEAETLDAEVDEPLDVERRVRFEVLREAFWAGGGDPKRTRTAYAEVFERRILAGDAPVGLFADQWRDGDHATLDGWRGNLELLGLRSGYEVWPVVRVGRAQEFAHVDRLLPAISLTVPRPDGGTQPVELHGPLLRLHPRLHIAIRCLSSGAVANKHFLPGFVSMMALAALDHTGDSTFHVISTPTEASTRAKMTRKYAVPGAEQARAWLTTVVHDLLYQPVDYRLPIEVVLRWRDDKAQGRGYKPFMPRNDRNSAAFGPVRDVQRFGLPPTAAAEEMVRRRFLPWFQAER